MTDWALDELGEAGASHGVDPWIVVLEARAEPPLQFHQVKALVRRLPQWNPSGLYSLERHALQLQIPTPRHDDALALAIASHDRTLQDLGVRASHLLRAEVMTVGEQKLGTGQTLAEVQERRYEAMIPTALYEATRGLLRASSRAQIDEVLTGFVIAVGGTVNIGELRYFPGEVSVDLGLSPSDSMYATADAASVAGLMIEQSLPLLIHDAERMMTRLPGVEHPNLR